MRLALTVALSLGLILSALTGAEARRSSHNTEGMAFDRHSFSGDFQMRYYYIGERSSRPSRSMKRSHAKRAHHARHRSVRVSRHASSDRRSKRDSKHEVQIVSHPSGCPSRAFCGCGSSIEVFGRSIRELWLAANWLKFPRAAPAPGMAAARRGHVFVIRKVIKPGLVLAYDPNSGGHRTRIHVRSLRGFTVVNPKGSRYALATATKDGEWQP